jgi:hypothetical protein
MEYGIRNTEGGRQEKVGRFCGPHARKLNDSRSLAGEEKSSRRPGSGTTKPPVFRHKPLC